jgi:hypothetical protein
LIFLAVGDISMPRRRTTVSITHAAHNELVVVAT